jgi:glucokinase
VIAAYLERHGSPTGEIGGVCVAAAGPVRDGVAAADQPRLAHRPRRAGRALTAERVAVLNDLQAQGHAIGHIAAENLVR